MTPRPLKTLLALAAAMLLPACGGGDDVACTLEVRASVVLHVTDTSGQPLDAVQVDYRVDDGTPQRVVCSADRTCELGQELSGRFSITASKAGYRAQSAVVVVSADVCHVRTERLTLVLPAQR